MKDLKQKAIRGSFAKICSQAANLTLRVGSLMIMARLLDPADFGLVAMVTALTGILNVFRDFGLSAATVQRTNVTDAQISTLFWINLFVGVVLTCFAMAVAPIVASFYREPRLVAITIALAIGFLLNATGVQHTALLQRNMRFATLAGIDTFSLVLSIGVGIGMALAGWGYWSLVGMTLVTPLASSVSVWVASAWIPGRPARGSGVGSLIKFGGTITLNSVVVYIAYNLEKVLLGRYWGPDALGIYGRAYQLINIPTENFTSALGDVAFSALSRIKEDADRFKSYFLKGYALVVTCTLPITVCCALFADDLVLLILGAKWSEAAPIFRLLAPTILIYAMINPMWWLMLSLGMAGRSLRVGLVLAPIVIASYVAGLPYGPKGVALGYSFAMTLWVIPHLAWCVHGTVVSLKDLFRVLSRPLLASVIAGLVASGTIALASGLLSPFGRLAVGIPTLLIVYVGILFYAMGQKAFYLDLVRGLLKRSEPGPGTGAGSGQ